MWGGAGVNIGSRVKEDLQRVSTDVGYQPANHNPHGELGTTRTGDRDKSQPYGGTLQVIHTGGAISHSYTSFNESHTQGSATSHTHKHCYNSQTGHNYKSHT